MQIVRRIADIKSVRQSFPPSSTVGFVPTMGALHDGHLALMIECDHVITSIFVNPTQFGVNEDFSSYPRLLDEDFKKLEGISDVVFCPEAKEMYPRTPHVNVSMNDVVKNNAEAKSRPQMFNGVATVVAKLLNLTTPDLAYFGQKDGIQCIVIRRLLADLNISTKMKICETIREPDGLAMSSRNQYLSESERKLAPILYKALVVGSDTCMSGKPCRKNIIGATMNVLNHPDVQVDYVSVASLQDGNEISEINCVDGALLSAAITIGNTRLIDNIIIHGSLDYDDTI